VENKAAKLQKHTSANAQEQFLKVKLKSKFKTKIPRDLYNVM